MDIDEILLLNPENRELVSLLAASSNHNAEKQLWLTLIPVMTDAEKKELKASLERQIQQDIDYDERVLKTFIKKLATV